MTTEPNFPQVGDPAVELRWAMYGQDSCGKTTTVTRVTDTLVITSDGRRYNRKYLQRIGEFACSDRILVPATDPRVLAIKGREHLTALARTADNLARLDHKTPEDVVAALAQLIVAAGVSRNAVIALMAEASRTEQESP
jgi:GTPase SAR1 family protein